MDVGSRQLAVIMFTDIVGYTAHMNKDEHLAFAYLKQNRDLQKPLIAANNGQWIKELGDGVLASFKTVSDAVHAAVTIQENCHANLDFQLRIGIHLGEVLFEDDDVFGDGVNIASRIQAKCSPGSIFVSEAVSDNISNKKDFSTRFVGEEQLKNVQQPVRIFELLTSVANAVDATTPEKTVEVENSIAVLPFVNMSSDPEQEYFSDGISEEIINILAQVSDLKVTGRTSAFAFKGQNIDLKVIGEQLNVQYLLEGSVRKSGSKLRITAQLIKASDGFHMFSKTYDRELEDIFDIQDEVSLAILEAVKIELLGEEKKAVLKKDTVNIEAHEQYLQGLYHYNKFMPESFMKAIERFHAAIAIDPEYALAYVGLSFCYLNMWFFNWLPGDQSLPQGIEAAEKAIELDDELAESHLAMGRVRLHCEWNVPEALVEYEKAIQLNPNSAECHVQLAFCYTSRGDQAKAMEHADKALELDPFSLLNLYYVTVIPWSFGDYNRMEQNGQRLIDLDPNFHAGHGWVGAALVGKKRYEEALVKMEHAAALYPSLLTLGELAFGYAHVGNEKKIEEIFARMEQLPVPQFDYYRAIAHAVLGNFDQAYEYLYKALETHESMIPYLGNHLREFPAFLNDPRTAEFIEKMDYKI